MSIKTKMQMAVDGYNLATRVAWRFIEEHCTADSINTNGEVTYCGFTKEDYLKWMNDK